MSDRSRPDIEQRIRLIDEKINDLINEKKTLEIMYLFGESDDSPLSSTHDLTGRDRELKELIAETSPVGITVVDKDGRIVFANTRAEITLTLKKSRITDRTYDDPQWDITDLDGNPFPQEELPFFKVRETCRPVYDVRHIISSARGKKIALSINASPILDHGRAFQGMVATLEDITEKIRIEREYRSLFDSMINGFAVHEIICDESGKPVDYRFLSVNPAFERLTGLRADDILGRTVLEVMPETEGSWIRKYGSVALEGKSLAFENYSGELKRWFRVTAYQHEPGYFACVFEDITDQKALEERLRQSQKLEVVGTLAGGVAHEFNNLLYVIMGNCELMEESVPEGDKEFLREILNASKRGGDLVKQLLAFSRKTEANLRPLSLNDELKRIQAMLGRTLPRMIDIVLVPDEGIAPVMADSGQVEQVVLNLALNARDAMPEGGTLTIRTERGHVDETFLEAHPAIPKDKGLTVGECVILSASDTGSGMDPDVRAKIFDPFFTTKEFGRGSGLGLSVIYGIIESHKGHVVCDSEKGKGTTFRIYFPAVRGGVVTDTAQPRVAEALPQGPETVLVVDDEKGVQTLTRLLLEGLGYRVLTASSGEAALSCYHENKDSVELVLLDIGMPGMGGKKCLAELLTINPKLKVVMVSGYAGEGLVRDSTELGARDYIIKPFLKNKLAETVRAVLDQP